MLAQEDMARKIQEKLRLDEELRKQEDAEEKKTR